MTQPGENLFNGFTPLLRGATQADKWTEQVNSLIRAFARVAPNIKQELTATMPSGYADGVKIDGIDVDSILQGLPTRAQWKAHQEYVFGIAYCFREDTCVLRGFAIIYGHPKNQRLRIECYRPWFSINPKCVSLIGRISGFWINCQYTSLQMYVAYKRLCGKMRVNNELHYGN